MRNVVDHIAQCIDASPSPFHAVQTAIRLLTAAGYEHYAYDASFPIEPGKHVISRAGSLVAIDTRHLRSDSVFRIIGAHTDSPNLRIKQHPHSSVCGAQRLLCEPYGGALLHTWLDRDLAIAGRVISSRDGKLYSTLVHTPPVMMIPSLAIHLAADRNDPHIDRQTHVHPIFGMGDDQLFSYLASLDASIDPGAIMGFDLMAVDTAPCARLGVSQEFLVGPRFDNQISSFCAITALCDIAQAETREVLPYLSEGIDTKDSIGSVSLAENLSSVVPVVVLFDHEEVGSTSERGANSHFLLTILERLCAEQGIGRAEFLHILTKSLLFSADMAHATHPNYSDRHEVNHQIHIGGGPVVKMNYNLRYATDGEGAASFIQACLARGVPWQTYLHRADLPCGSTIGPMSAAQTGILTVDIGAPQLAMHSIREFMSVQDVEYYVQTMLGILSWV